MYWVALIAWSVALAYLALFTLAPYARDKARGFGDRVLAVLNSQPAPTTSKPIITMTPVSTPVPAKENARFSTYEGFKSFAREGALSIEDIVKGLSRVPSAASAPVAPQPVMPEVPAASQPVSAPVVEIPAPRVVEVAPQPAPRVMPVYQKAEPIAPVREEVVPHVRGFIAALLVRDRETVFSMLRVHTRSGGSAEQLLTDAALALDEAYRARVDGTPADADIVRVAAGYDAPMLEKIISILLSSMDSTYSDSSTSAKLVLMRILALG